MLDRDDAMIGKSNPQIRERNPKVEQNPPAYNPDTEKRFGDEVGDAKRGRDSAVTDQLLDT